MSYEVKGKLVFIGSTAQVTDTFRKKEFAIEIKEVNGDKEYIKYVKLQLTQAKTELLNGYGVGDNINCYFNLSGSKSIKNGVTNYFTNIECWEIEKADSVQEAGKAYQKQSAPANLYVNNSDISTDAPDDLPF